MCPSYGDDRSCSSWVCPTNPYRNAITMAAMINPNPYSTARLTPASGVDFISSGERHYPDKAEIDRQIDREQHKPDSGLTRRHAGLKRKVDGGRWRTVHCAERPVRSPVRLCVPWQKSRLVAISGDWTDSSTCEPGGVSPRWSGPSRPPARRCVLPIDGVLIWQIATVRGDVRENHCLHSGYQFSANESQSQLPALRGLTPP